MSSARFFRLLVPPSELSLERTLQSGQCFRWVETRPGSWRGVVGRQVWTLRREGDFLCCHVIQGHADVIKKETDVNQIDVIKVQPDVIKKDCDFTKGDLDLSKGHLDVSASGRDVTEEECAAAVRSYFRLDDVSLAALSGEWARRDAHYARVASRLPGVRMLDQDPVETVFAFICSANNNIKRITQLVERLCSEFGSPMVAEEGSPAEKPETTFSFPAIEALATPGTEQTLRRLGFGYRARYIAGSADLLLQKGGRAWLRSLRGLPYAACREQVAALPGVGPKVADCICLMSLGHLAAVPVDTHMLQVAARDYALPALRGVKSLTPRVYALVGDHFRALFGPKAGWAQSVLFAADLAKFKAPEDDVIKAKSGGNVIKGTSDDVIKGKSDDVIKSKSDDDVTKAPKRRRAK